MARSPQTTKISEAALRKDAPPVSLLYQLKVSIAYSRPLIWRRVLVPAHDTLSDLDRVIQALMGWDNSHLHDFELPAVGETGLKTRKSRRTARRFTPRVDPLGEPFDWMLEEDEEDQDEAAVHLDEAVPHAKMHFLYTYDMGDNWEHDIVVEKILPAEAGGVYPICVAGERNGPIEDSGGIGGYEYLLEILADPAHRQYAERKDWLRDAFGLRTWDGEAFDLDGINKRLKRLQPKAKAKRVIRRTTQ